MNIILGFDLGTSGIRVCIVEQTSNTTKTLAESSIAKNTNSKEVFSEAMPEVTHEVIGQQQAKIVAHVEISLPIPRANTNTNTNTQCQIAEDPTVWVDAFENAIKKLGQNYDLKAITHIIGDATSSTTLLTDNKNRAVSQALMYNDASSKTQALTIDEICNQLQINFTAAKGANSSLAKSLNLAANLKTENKSTQTLRICHQLDLINHFLLGKNQLQAIVTDENNALKLGYDSIHNQWPDWVKNLTKSLNLELPRVVAPGTVINKICTSIAHKFNLNPQAKVCAGTTDSIAGFLATGAEDIGCAVSSLGSTIALKYISEEPVFDSNFGLYSHKLGNQWLVGGASNAGGRVFLNYYSTEELNQLCQSIINNDEISGSDSYANCLDKYLGKYLEQKSLYYPLSQKGERFPIANSQLQPKLPKTPNLQLDFNNPTSLQQHQEFVILLSLGLANIEALALSRLCQATNSELKKVISIGGGNKNPVWQYYRNQLIDAPCSLSEFSNPAYGVTRLIKNTD